jgi:hypothetical protein
VAGAAPGWRAACAGAIRSRIERASQAIDEMVRSYRAGLPIPPIAAA